MIEVRHLRLVRAICEEGGITKAGKRLHLTQSALSCQLREIEADLGTKLFLRLLRARDKRVYPTGMAVYARVDRLVSSRASECVRNMSSSAHVCSGRDEQRRVCRTSISCW